MPSLCRRLWLLIDVRARSATHEGDEYEVTHDGQDSRLDHAMRQRLCFDASGVVSRGDGAECMDTFRWGRCGGECVATPVPTCRIVEGNCQRVKTNEGTSWETATYQVSLNEVATGTLRLSGNRYAYEGEDSPEAFGAAFYFIEHPTGVLRTEAQGDRTLGLVRFDPEGSDFEPMNPRRTLEVRQGDGFYWMHSIVGEFQNWSIRTE
ncbi:MAG: hypothetical protein ACI9KE_003187 [Polyangiales bacterium]|jgi:hypothetical protein